jgi:hypothetical protein
MTELLKWIEKVIVWYFYLVVGALVFSALLQAFLYWLLAT